MEGGFTLVELLVVVAIIGILATVVVISYSGAQMKARDAKRISDLNTINSAIQIWYTSSGASNYLDGNCNNQYYTASDPGLNSILVPTYLPAIPADPNALGYYNTDYTYFTPNHNNTAGSCVPANLKYTSTYYYLLANLEDSTNKNKNWSQDTFLSDSTNGLVAGTNWGMHNWHWTTSTRDAYNFYYIKGGN